MCDQYQGSTFLLGKPSLGFQCPQQIPCMIVERILADGPLRDMSHPGIIPVCKDSCRRHSQRQKMVRPVYVNIKRATDWLAIRRQRSTCKGRKRRNSSFGGRGMLFGAQAWLWRLSQGFLSSPKTRQFGGRGWFVVVALAPSSFGLLKSPSPSRMTGEAMYKKDAVSVSNARVGGVGDKAYSTVGWVGSWSTEMPWDDTDGAIASIFICTARSVTNAFSNNRVDERRPATAPCWETRRPSR
jgi:hypothetical protein